MTAWGLAIVAAVVTALAVPVHGWLLVPVVVVAAVLGWWIGSAIYLAMAYRMGSRRSRREAEREYERRTGRPFPGRPKKRGPEPPDGTPAAL
jgi:hypothetical protein